MSAYQRTSYPENTHKSKKAFFNKILPICIGNFIMGYTWCIFNESFEKLDEAINLHQDWNKDWFYGSVNGVYIFGA